MVGGVPPELSGGLAISTRLRGSHYLTVDLMWGLDQKPGGGGRPTPDAQGISLPCCRPHPRTPGFQSPPTVSPEPSPELPAPAELSLSPGSRYKSEKAQGGAAGSLNAALPGTRQYPTYRRIDPSTGGSGPCFPAFGLTSTAAQRPPTPGAPGRRGPHA